MAPSAQLQIGPVRVQTFTKKRPAATRSLQWPFDSSSSLDPVALAHAGWHHCPTKALPLRTRCFLCPAEVSVWEEGDSPLDVHLQANGECGWAIIKSEEWTQPRDKTQWNWGHNGHKWPRGERWSKAREQTFAVGWPHEGVDGLPTKEHIAAAGWHFAPQTGDGFDRCVCAFCTRSVEGWEEGDDPVAIHRRKLGLKCPFFLAPEPAAAKPKAKVVKSKSKKQLAAEARAAEQEEEHPEEEEAPVEEEPVQSQPARASRSRKAKVSNASTKPPGSPERESVEDEVDEEPVKARAKGKKSRKQSALPVEPEPEPEPVVVQVPVKKSTRSSKAKSSILRVSAIPEVKPEPVAKETIVEEELIIQEEEEAVTTPVVEEDDEEEEAVEPKAKSKKKKKQTSTTKKSKPKAVKSSSAPTTAPPSPTSVRPPLTPMSTNSPHQSTVPLNNAPMPSTPKPPPTPTVVKAYVAPPNPFLEPLVEPTEEERKLSLEKWYDLCGRREQEKLDTELEKGIVEFESSVEAARSRLMSLIDEAKVRADRARQAARA